MTGNLDAFCERCGKTATPPVPAAAPTGPKSLRRFLPGARARVEPDPAPALSLCLGCRGYICTECWNDAASVCQTCQPLAGVGLPVEAEASTEPVAPGLGLFDDGRPVAHRDLSVWPASDLYRDRSAVDAGFGPDLDTTTIDFDPSTVEVVPEPATEHEFTLDARAEADEPASGQDDTAADQAGVVDDRWAELIDRIQALGAGSGPAPAGGFDHQAGDVFAVEPPVASELEVEELVDEPVDELAAEPVAAVAQEFEPLAEAAVEVPFRAPDESEPEALAELEAPAPVQAELQTLADVQEVVAAEPAVEPDAEAQVAAESAAERDAAVAFETPPDVEEPVAVVEPVVVDAPAAIEVQAGAEPPLEASFEPVAVEEPAAPESAELDETSAADPEEELWASLLEEPDAPAESEVAEPDLKELTRTFQPRRFRRRVARQPRRPARPPAAQPVEPATMSFVEEQPVEPAPPAPPAPPRLLKLPPALPPQPPATTQPWPMPAPPAFLPPPPMLTTIQPAPARFRPQVAPVEAPKLPATRPCGKCGLELSAKVMFCRRCGTRQTETA